MSDLDRAVRLSDVPDARLRMRRVKASVWMTLCDTEALTIAQAALMKAAKDAGAQDVTVRVTEEVG